MPKVDALASRLMNIRRMGDVLVLQKTWAPYATRSAVVTTFGFLAVMLLAGAAVAIPVSSLLSITLLVLGLCSAGVAVYYTDIRRYAAKELTFRFDRDLDYIEHNGRRIAKVTEVEHVLVRRILGNDNEAPDQSNYALVISLEGGRRFTVAESEGPERARERVLQAAEEVAAFLSVPITEGERLATEDWMDR